MRFIDTHCHLNDARLIDQVDEVLSTAQREGVVKCVIPGTTRESWQTLSTLQSKYDQVAVAAGLHPYFIDQHAIDDLSALASLFEENSKGWAAVGEVGLDYRLESIKKQQSFLSAQLDLAKSFDKPVILHSVKSHDTLAKMLREHNIDRGVVHGFSGSPEQAKRFVEQGIAIGVGGVITHDRARKTRMAIASLPLNAIVLETDAPDMPMSHQGRGEPNVPANILYAFNALCTIREESEEEIANTILETSCALFGLSF